MTKKQQDTEFEDFILDKVVPYEKKYLITSNGQSLLLPVKHSIVPKVGDIARFYGKGFGYVVRGVDINGVQVFYRTDAQQKALDARRRIAQANKERKLYQKKKLDFDVRMVKLPEEFYNRILRFRETTPEWGRRFEDYELFCAEQAVLIATYVSEQDIDDFYGLPWEEQCKRVPGLSDGHSGNTFETSCRLAHLYQTRPDLIVKAHGAMCALVGCEEYGCYAAYEAKEEKQFNETIAV